MYNIRGMLLLRVYPVILSRVEQGKMLNCNMGHKVVITFAPSCYLYSKWCVWQYLANMAGTACQGKMADRL